MFQTLPQLLVYPCFNAWWITPPPRQLLAVTSHGITYSRIDSCLHSSRNFRDCRDRFIPTKLKIGSLVKGPKYIHRNNATRAIYFFLRLQHIKNPSYRKPHPSSWQEYKNRQVVIRRLYWISCCLQSWPQQWLAIRAPPNSCYVSIGYLTIFFQV